jgi:hypothetical protein
MPRVSLHPALIMLVFVGALGGCAWVPEPTQRAWQSDVSKLSTAFQEIPSLWRPAPQPSQACLLWFSEDRVVQQDNVSDEVRYRRCPNTATYAAMGQRLDARPQLGETGPLPPARMRE